jgi:hypothetical protein
VARRSELIRELAALDYLASYDVAPLVDRLILPSRNAWNDVTQELAAKEFDFSKFDRRLSLIGRPIVALSNEADPEVMVAPGVVERAFMHNIAGAVSGALQNDFWQSAKMRSYSGSAGARAGIEFNISVAEALSRMGLRAWPSAKPSWCLNRKNTEELKQLGDIDVLAISAEGQIVWVVEAKDLKLCRTLGEAARRLSEYRGQYTNNGKPDQLMRHLRRVDFLRANAPDLIQRLGLLSVPQVHGVLIVNAPQPMQQLQQEYSMDSTAVMLTKLESIPWSKGWTNDRA